MPAKKEEIPNAAVLAVAGLTPIAEAAGRDQADPSQAGHKEELSGTLLFRGGDRPQPPTQLHRQGL